MLLRFFETLREFRVPISTRELLDLLAVMREGIVFADRDGFYVLARLCLVKDERYFDRFDRAFKFFFDAIGSLEGLFDEVLPAESLQAPLRALLEAPPQRRAGLEAEFRNIMQQYRQAVATARAARLGQAGEGAAPGDDGGAAGDPSQADEPKAGDDAAQQADGSGDAAAEGGEQGDDGEGEGEGEAQGEGEGEGDGDEGESGEDGDGGEDGEGTQGDSDTGADGEHEQGTRKGQERSRLRVATRVWEERLFADLDDDVELGTRTFKIALRRLRKFARIGAAEELDMPGTIQGTASNGGILDIRMVPERRNSVKVLLFLDIGGSMDEHVQVCEQLFSAAGSEFKYLVEHYFHNFIYDHVWTHAARRDEHRVDLFDVVRKYGRDCKVVVVGDANMGLHEILERGGCIERYNEEPGLVSFNRLTEHFKRVVWINPTPVAQWPSTFSIVRVQRMLEGHMYPLTNEGLTGAMRWLAR